MWIDKDNYGKAVGKTAEEARENLYNKIKTAYEDITDELDRKCKFEVINEKRGIKMFWFNGWKYMIKATKIENDLWLARLYSV